MVSRQSSHLEIAYIITQQQPTVGLPHQVMDMKFY